MKDRKADKNNFTGSVARLLDHFFASYSEEFLNAFEQFFEDKSRIGPNKEIVIRNEMEEDLLMEWLVFDYRLMNGRKIIEDFIAKNPLKLNKKELEKYETMQFNKYGFFEVKTFVKDEWIQLESLQSGKLYKITENKGTHSAFIGQILLGRIGKVLDEWMLIGSNPIEIPIPLASVVKKTVKEYSGSFSPKYALKIISRNDLI